MEQNYLCSSVYFGGEIDSDTKWIRVKMQLLEMLKNL
jgi:hypothetical protein